jgi:hypothetical protein
MRKSIIEITDFSKIPIKKVICKGMYASLDELSRCGWQIYLCKKDIYISIKLYNKEDNCIVNSHSLTYSEYYNWNSTIILGMKAFGGKKKTKDILNNSNDIGQLLDKVNYLLSDSHRKLLKSKIKDNVIDINQYVRRLTNG